MTETSHFNEMKINQEIKEEIRKLGFTKSTAVQSKIIPKILEGKDVIVRSRTASGKTAAYLIPIVHLIEKHKNHISALIVLPTRELALQVEAFGKKLLGKSGINIVTVYGGVSLRPQTDKLRHADIVVGTPGRLLDHIRRGSLDIYKINYLVLDEADIMLDMGFFNDIDKIIEGTPKEKQTLLLSATMPREIKELSMRYMRGLDQISEYDEGDVIVNTIKHTYTISSSSFKFSTLLAYMDSKKPKKTIIFTNTRNTAFILYRILKDNKYDTMMLNGAMKQASRERSIREFKGMDGGVLITTDVASRGIDITDLTDIINFDAPKDPTVYTHRVGRTSRLGAEGTAFTIFGYEQKNLKDSIVRFAKIDMQKIVINIDNFKNIEFGKYVKSGMDEHRRSSFNDSGSHSFNNRNRGDRRRFGGDRFGRGKSNRDSQHGRPRNGGFRSGGNQYRRPNNRHREGGSTGDSGNF